MDLSMEYPSLFFDSQGEVDMRKEMSISRTENFWSNYPSKKEKLVFVFSIRQIHLRKTELIVMMKRMKKMKRKMKRMMVD